MPHDASSDRINSTGHQGVDERGVSIVSIPATGDMPAMDYAVYPPTNRDLENPPLVVHLYGSGGSIQEFNLQRAAYDELRRDLAAAGYWVVVPELGPYHWMNDRAVAMVDRLIDHCLTAYQVEPARVHLLGTSMGAGSGLRYLQIRRGRVRSMCAVFPMTDFETWLTETPRYQPVIAAAHQVAPDAMETLADLSAMRHLDAYAQTPLFILHGTADQVVPPHHSRDFAAALRARQSPVVYHEVPGIDHKDQVAADYQGEIFRFFEHGIAD